MPANGINKNSFSKSSLRSELRAKRRELSLQQQTLAATKVSQLLRRQPFFKRSKALAYYWANDGELSLHYLCVYAHTIAKQSYLPLLKPGNDHRLLFLPFDEKTPMVNNRFGIPEPSVPLTTDRLVWTLDVVFFPLVGFDNQGNRLGMGGGFYDRTFSTLTMRPRRPLLIGIGHSCQELEQVPIEPWDIALDAVATEEKIFCSKRIGGRHFRHQDCHYF